MPFFTSREMLDLRSKIDPLAWALIRGISQKLLPYFQKNEYVLPPPNSRCYIVPLFPNEYSFEIPPDTDTSLKFTPWQANT